MSDFEILSQVWMVLGIIVTLLVAYIERARKRPLDVFITCMATKK